MKTAKREDDRHGGHNRSTSRYSINRIQPHGKSPDVAAERSLKPSNSFLDLRANKENEDINYLNRPNQSTFQCATTVRDRKPHRPIEPE
jgi:hypothetical protein